MKPRTTPRTNTKMTLFVFIFSPTTKQTTDNIRIITTRILWLINVVSVIVYC